MSSSLFGGEPEVYEKTGRPPVMADQITHEDIDHVIVEGCHRYTDDHYSNK
jgi:hypothetical protein